MFLLSVSCTYLLSLCLWWMSKILFKPMLFYLLFFFFFYLFFFFFLLCKFKWTEPQCDQTWSLSFQTNLSLVHPPYPPPPTSTSLISVQSGNLFLVKQTPGVSCSHLWESSLSRSLPLFFLFLSLSSSLRPSVDSPHGETAVYAGRIKAIARGPRPGVGVCVFS